MKKIDLIQPRHNYASREGLGHVYMPTSLLTAGARLLDAGVDVEFHDENFQPASISSDVVGINLLGAPYIPEVIKLQKRLDGDASQELRYLLGGQVVKIRKPHIIPNGLTESQFLNLFGNRAYDGNDDANLIQLLGIDNGGLRLSSQTSLIPAYEKLPDKVMKEYLSRELSLYVAQGCKFACKFCAAPRSFRDPLTGGNIKAIESYRDQSIIKGDIEYLVQRAKKIGLRELQFYMSNLDVFQNPEQLTRFAYAVQDVKNRYPDFYIGLRGLATVSEFLRTRDNISKRNSIEKLIEAGFHTVGFGVDGWGIWKEVNKGQNTEPKCREAIKSAREDFGMIPETLMVFGHVGVDKEETLKRAYEVTLEWADRYLAVPRPHVSKQCIPGNDGWIDPKNVGMIEQLVHDPECFQALDFTALPSWLTHSDERLRELSTEYFLKICSIPGNTTLHVKPITPDLTMQEREEVGKFNEGRFDR